jgi:homoserine kinase
VHVRVPASSANLGPGFDALGMAVTLHAELGLIGSAPVPDGARTLDEHHPASRAFARAGGAGALWLRSPIPPGRGLGYSGAVRVAGLVLAHVVRHGADPERLAAARPNLLAAAAELEGHADNVAASLVGGIVATAGGKCVQVPLALDPAVVVWIPPSTTSTDQSRASLPEQVSFGEAAFNVGRVALLVAALAAGDVAALAAATEDRLHQDQRLARAERSREALAALRRARVWGAWLSGSGPSVAAWCAAGDADEVAAGLPEGGRTLVLRIDHEGAVVELG